MLLKLLAIYNIVCYLKVTVTHYFISRLYFTAGLLFIASCKQIMEVLFPPIKSSHGRFDCSCTRLLINFMKIDNLCDWQLFTVRFVAVLCAWNQIFGPSVKLYRSHKTNSHFKNNYFCLVSFGNKFSSTVFSGCLILVNRSIINALKFTIYLFI